MAILGCRSKVWRVVESIGVIRFSRVCAVAVLAKAIKIAQ
jgi:hypothetical protein